MSPQEAFHSGLSLTQAAKKLGMGRKRVEKVWSECFGVEAVKARAAKFLKRSSPETRAEAMAAFDSDEPFKAISKRLGISPNTLRVKWTEEYGVEAFEERGRRLRQRGVEAFGARSRGRSKKRTFVSTPCEVCGQATDLSKAQLARLNRVLCTSCDEAERGVDRHCPVCGFGCVGVKGLASHMARPQNGDIEAHRAYLSSREDSHWEGKREDVDFVVCQECGIKLEFLGNHLKLHGLTASEYREKYPLALLTTPLTEGKRLAGLFEPAQRRAYSWSREQLLQFADEKGHVVVAKAALCLDAAPTTVLGYCRKLDLPTKNKLAWQQTVLDCASKVFGPYEWEWSSDQLRNPDTNRPFNYDGFFPRKNLIVEAHGDQHYRYSESWHGTLDDFHKSRARDALKKSMAESLGYTVVVVRPSDPIEDISFWKSIRRSCCGVTNEAVAAVFEKLREGEFPQLRPSKVEARKALTRLSKSEPFLDSERIVRPYSTVGTSACASFFPSRHHARHKGHKYSAYDAWFDDNLLKKAVHLQLDSGHPTTPERVLRALVMFCHTPSVFRPIVSKYVCQMYANKGRVWDPCMGYGGRILGAAAAGVSSYVGTDIEPAIVSGNLGLVRALDLRGYRVLEHRAETFDPGPNLDLVFTSPPYFDLEVYGPAPIRYGSPQEWVREFLRPVIHRAASRLKLGGHLVLNLPSRPIQSFRLDLAAASECRDLLFDEKSACWLPVRTSGGRIKGEPLLIWQKGESTEFC